MLWQHAALFLRAFFPVLQLTLFYQIPFFQLFRMTIVAFELMEIFALHLQSPMRF